MNYSVAVIFMSASMLAPIPTKIRDQHSNWPRTAPKVKFAVWVSAKKAVGLSRIRCTVKPVPVSTPFARIPVVNGPVKQPTDTLWLPVP